MPHYTILKAGKCYVVKVTSVDGDVTYSPLFSTRARAQGWIIQQTLPK